jgi:hypothetical protein
MQHAQRYFLRVAASLPDASQALLDGALPRSRFGLHRVLETQALMATLGRTDIHVLVVDPAQMRDIYFDTFITKAQDAPCALVFYTALDHIVARRIVRAAALVLSDVILVGFDDQATRVQHCIAGAASVSASTLLIRRMQDRIMALPPEIQLTLISLLYGAAFPKTAEGFAARCMMSRRSVDRWLRRCGLPSCAVAMDACRVARMWSEIECDFSEPAYSPAWAGYASNRTLADLFHNVTGLTKRSALHALSRSGVADRIENWLRHAASHEIQHGTRE